MLWEKTAQTDGLTLGMFQRLIRPGDMVYDIGANIGLYSRIMLSWFKAGRVLAFEPMRENLDLLHQNVTLSGASERFRVLPLALSDIEGEEDLQIDDMTSGTAVLTSVSGGAASIGRQEYGLPPLSERVRIVRLDDLITRENLPPPNMMKIDTEGAEVKVLTGARETLGRHRPRLCIALHATDKTIGTLNLLDDLGYSAFGFVKDSQSNELWRQLHAGDAEHLSNNNIVASCDLADVRNPIQQYQPHRT